LNITPKYWKDLISGEPFTKKDIITLQVRKWMLADFNQSINQSHLKWNSNFSFIHRIQMI
jgi:hypothetical protein